MKINLVISAGQYESAAKKLKITATTYGGFCRRIDQLKKEYAVYGDNWTGWIDADVAIASKDDEWGDNDIIGGMHCTPKNGWIAEDPSGDYRHYCSYQDAWIQANSNANEDIKTRI